MIIPPYNPSDAVLLKIKLQGTACGARRVLGKLSSLDTPPFHFARVNQNKFQCLKYGVLKYQHVYYWVGLGPDRKVFECPSFCTDLHLHLFCGVEKYIFCLALSYRQ